MLKRSFTQLEKSLGGYSTHALPTRTAENLPSYVEDKVKEFEDRGYDADYAWPMAWSIYCKHQEPNSPHCHQEEYLTKQASRLAFETERGLVKMDYAEDKRHHDKIPQHAKVQIIKPYLEQLEEIQPGLYGKFLDLILSGDDHKIIAEARKVSPKATKIVNGALWAIAHSGGREPFARKATLDVNLLLKQRVLKPYLEQLEEIQPGLYNKFLDLILSGDEHKAIAEAQKVSPKATKIVHGALWDLSRTPSGGREEFHRFPRKASLSRQAGRVKDLLVDTLEPFMQKIHKSAPEIADMIEEHLMGGDYKEARDLAKANSEVLKEVNLAIKTVEDVFHQQSETSSIIEKHIHELQQVSPENWEDLRDALTSGESNPSVLRIKITPEIKKVYTKIYTELKRVKKHASSVVGLSDGDYMSHQGLAQLRDMAESILEHIPEGMEFDDWVEFKIATAVTSLSDVFNYLRFRG